MATRKQKTNAPRLEIKTNTARQRIRIDGNDYELRDFTELSIFDGKRFASAGERIDAIIEAADPSPEEAAELDQALDELCRIVLDAPSEIHEKLNDQARLKIMRAFMELLPAELQEAGTKAAMEGLAKRKTRTP